MPPDSPPPSRGVRSFFKRIGRGVKKAFKPSDQAPASHVPSASPQTPPRGSPTQTVTSRALTPVLPPQSSARSQQGVVPLQPALSPGQPPPITSPSAANSNQTGSMGSSSALGADSAGANAWGGLKTALQVLKECSVAFPPLQAAVGGFLKVADVVESVAKNRKDYEELDSELQAMVKEFKDHPKKDTFANISRILVAMVDGLEEENKHVERQKQRSGLKRLLKAEEDVEDVERCRRSVETLCRELQYRALIEILSNQEQKKVDARLQELDAALKAMYDSSLAGLIGRRMCTPGTREAILQEMREWADDPNGPKVYWLDGMAGTGKTTLAYSFCEQMQRDRRLGASFFCSREDPRSRDVSNIVPTIAHQLARLLPSYREALVRRIDEPGGVIGRDAKSQFEKLIRDPLREVEVEVPEGAVVVIDALDECDRRDGAREILDALLLHARDLPIKFMVACRPEPGLYNRLQSKDEHHRSVLHLHDIEDSFVHADIKKYLEEELAETTISAERLGILAEQAGTLFIYAATAVRYILPKVRVVNIDRRVEDLLSLAPRTGTIKHRAIDSLYTAVLAAPFADETLNPQDKENIRLVLDTAICAREPMSITTMAKLLKWEEEQDVVLALEDLRSVLHVSQDNNLISTLHASFRDFMLDKERSKDQFCNPPKHHQHLALCCCDTMQRLLKFNICSLESSFDLDENDPNLAEKVDKAITPELFYACRYWGVHLGLAESSSNVHSALESFLSNRLLFWMEVLNLRKCIGPGAQTLVQLHAWLQKSGGAHSLLELVLDAGKFATAFGLSPASRSTPHIYMSTLPCWPAKRPVRLRYWKRTKGLIRLEGSGVERRDLSCLAVWNTGGGVASLAQSPDGTHIVSNSSGNTIRVWDARSGDPVAGPFKGHTDRVASVGFSPDGNRIVSGSRDKTIRVWDAHDGNLVAGPFEGHIKAVSSVGFSSDGARIVSGSHDKTIRVWDARTGDLVAGPFEGHTRPVSSVGFSPDGARIVSGSWDKTIRAWDARSGDLAAGPFEGHTDSVLSVGFSSDGARIVSGSKDKTVRIWNAYSGDLVTKFTGHTESVKSVGFSSDGTRIVSGSWDSTICVWDARSGDLVAGPFRGHTNRVTSVGFSPDGNYIVSSSYDETIRVWDSRNRDLVAVPLEGHTKSVTSVELSSDGTRIVSGSDDKTICVWDARTGDLAAGPFEGHTGPVISVGFSSDGTRIVSGSRDCTMRVWDAHSGDLVAGPFREHTNKVTSVGFSSDGTRIVSGTWDSTIHVWDARTGGLIAGSFRGHTDLVGSVGFSSDGTRIVSGSWDKTIRVWDARTGDLVAGPFEGHTSSVTSVGFSPDGARIVSGSWDKTIRVWDARSGDLAAGPFEGHTDLVLSVGFSSDGARIVSGSRDKTVRVWNAYSGDLVTKFTGHTELVKSVGFSLDGTRVVSCSRDSAIRIWVTPSLHSDNGGLLNDWQMDEIGTVTTQRNQLLLCVPVDLWTGLVRPQNTVCIYAKGTVKLDFDGVLLGKKWAGCYES